MVDEKISVGIIGVGQIGKLHVENYLSMPNVKVIAIAGRDPGRTEAVARQYNLPYWTTDYRALLDKKEIDAVSVCLHNNLHMPVSTNALKVGKHVFCEKPIAGSYQDGVTMLKTAQENNRILAIQLSDLFNRESVAAREVIEKGWLGIPYLAHSAGFRRRERPFVDGYGTAAFVQKEFAGGGALLDMGVYHIANILYLLGNPKPMRISGRTFQQTEMDEVKRAESHYDVEESAVGLVALENKMTLSIIETWAMHLDQLESSYITGTKGGVRLKPFGVFRNDGDQDLNSLTKVEDFKALNQSQHVWKNFLEGPQQHFIAALLGKAPIIPTAEIALNTMLISEGIYLSDKLGREVTTSEVTTNSVSSALSV
jgi:predicted dehydrogenase